MVKTTLHLIVDFLYSLPCFVILVQIHHVDGNGFDGGVVYSEASSRLTFSYNNQFYPFLRHIFKENCLYNYSPVGSQTQLREATIEKLKDHHQQYYRAHNITIYVFGSLSKEKLFQSIRTVDEEEEAKGKNASDSSFQSCTATLGMDHVYEYEDGKNWDERVAALFEFYYVLS